MLKLFVPFFAVISLFVFNAAYGEDDSSPRDTAALESRIFALEEALKKKADKPDPMKGFTSKLDGRIYFDSYHLSGDNQSDTPSFRDDLYYNGIKDLRIGATGEGYRNYAYKVDLFFGNGNTVEIRDVWLSASDVPLLDTVKIGNHRVEEGISSLLAGFHTQFIFYDGADFINFYRLGLSSQHLWVQKRLRLFAGVFEFKPVAQQLRNETAAHVNWGTIANTRLTYMPYISKDKDGTIDGKHFMLFGINYGYYDVNDANQAFNERYGQLFGTLQRISIDSVDAYQQVGLEYVFQRGPFAAQSETYVRTYNRYGNRSDVTIWGLYLEGRVFLTGDFRRFNADQAVWSGVTLKHNLEFVKERDWNLAKYLGAWELAGKWSYIDFNDCSKAGISGVLADRVHDFTLGLNWYWAERTRVMFNYTRILPADKVGGHSGIDLFATSLRYYF
ncbi:MAG: porin [Planctomycetaceae bacterium]|nr:porin [Planctomycetaceae bacterium]